MISIAPDPCFSLLPFIVAILLSALTLRVACWVANRILPPAVPATLQADQGNERTYRTVEAGPFTSPGTAQLDPAPTLWLAMPEPNFLHAAGIALAGLMAAGLPLWALLLFLAPPVYWREPAWFWVIWGGATIAEQYVLNVLMLPTTWVRGALITFFHAAGLVLLVLIPAVVLGLGMWVARNG